jgi:hypothetical protein
LQPRHGCGDLYFAPLTGIMRKRMLAAVLVPR